MSSRKASKHRDKRHSKRVSEVEHKNFQAGQDPALVLWFEASENPVQIATRDKTIQTLKDCGFLVGESKGREFVKVSLPEWRMLVHAESEELKIRCRLKIHHGGALHEFKKDLQDEYQPCSEDTVLSSAQQLMVIEHAMTKDRAHGGADIDIADLKETKVLKQVFQLHYEPARARLEEQWANSWFKPQPIELIREYFGEKVALYFFWLGYYTAMLWIPALCGVLLTISQLYTSLLTGSLDNPWVPLYCVFTALWAVVFLARWKRMEETKKLEWDTCNFEEEEEDRPEFKKTEKRRNKATQEDEDYYPKEHRWLIIAGTTSIVIAFISMVLAVVTAIMFVKQILINLVGPIGGAVGSALQAGSIMGFNIMYGGIVGHLTDWENWRTNTEYEDALIGKDFCFKFVNSYFALFFVAFIQNHVSMFGITLHCPDFHCMPVLTMTLGIVFGTQIVVQQSMEIGKPILLKKWKEIQASKKSASDPEEEELPLSPEEDQSNMEEYEGVFEDYNEMVVQFGYVTLFAAAFPTAATLALVNNITEIRVDALKMVMATKRFKYQVAADIGTWMSILEILTTVAIMTNCCLVGFVSHGLYFYFPDLTPAHKVWTVVVAEHILMFFKIVLQSTLSEPDTLKSQEYEAQQHFKNKALKRFQQARRGHGHDHEEGGGFAITEGEDRR